MARAIAPGEALPQAVRRLKRTRAAQTFKQRVLEPYRLRGEPLLSVVVPFHDSRAQLAGTLESLLAQTHRKLDVVLVDDGSTDGSRDVAERYAAAHRTIRVVGQEHRGVGAARTRGIEAASGDYLTFCDSDDLVLPDAYARLVGALEASGSDLAIGSVATQVKGRFEVPGWAHRSNPSRRLHVGIEDAPHALGNLVLGSWVFRRSFWDREQLAFTVDERGDVTTMVTSLLAAGAVDVLPAVVYRWSWREDDRSLLQRDLRDKDRVAQRVRAVREAGQVLVDQGSERLQTSFFAEVLHSVVADLVRAAVCRQDGYWEALAGELRQLMASMSATTFEHVPVEDRIIAWLCAHDEREATEEFLEYAFDNRAGYPFRTEAGRRPLIDLPFVEALGEAGDELKRVAVADMVFRARLLRLTWKDDGRLLLEGAAFVEYLDARSGPSRVTLVLTEHESGAQVRVPTRTGAGVVGAPVNQWAGRASEDHSGGAFEVLLDVTQLPVPESGRARFTVDVELEQGGFSFSGSFRSRLASGSPGLLERRTQGPVTYVPTWRDHRGLGLVIRRSASVEASSPPPEVSVDELTAAGAELRIAGSCTGDLGTGPFEVALVGPRGSTSWATADRHEGRFSVALDVRTDEWGLGATSLPADTYEVRARTSPGRGTRGRGTAGREVAVACDPALWRRLPRPLDEGEWTFVPSVDPEGALRVRVVPVEWQVSRPALLRRRLRDEAYPAAKEKPLLDTVLFETFAGKGTGDNPGAILAEFHARGLGLDLVYSVIDRSNVVPDGARAVVRWSPEWFELLGRARYLVVNASLPYFFRKREGQLYYQTWHGTPLKRIAHDRPHLDFFNWHHRRQLLVARSGWDYLLSQSEFCSRALSSAFRYDGPVMEVGYPRNDVLRSPERDEIRRRTRAHFGLDEHTVAVLYAPTWRDNLRVGAVFNKVLYLDPHEVVAGLGDCAVLVRGHYNSVGAAEERSGDDRILDVTRYPDIADLYLAADVLVTDYSSVFFDFSLTDKPMIFLAPDLEEYRDDNRGFYLDYHEVVPGPVCLSTAEVVSAIRAPDGFAAAREAFRARFNPLDDGAAASRVVDAVLAAFPPAGSLPKHSHDE